jgi:actin-related protein
VFAVCAQTPVFESFPIEGTSQTYDLGGNDLDAYMAALLLSRKNETFNQNLERRQHKDARDIKERHAFVAQDFESEVCEGLLLQV